MNNPKYVFDTNVFIKLKNEYASDIFIGLWEQIETLMGDGIIISSDEVIDEIKRGNDELEEWAKKWKNSFYTSDEPIQEIVREILKRFNSLVTRPKKTNGADPFIIALAKQMDCTIVTEEKRDGTEINPKIPYICDFYGIKCIKFLDFLRENSIKFY
jgi:predicted nucleic acid-binding protein